MSIILDILSADAQNTKGNFNHLRSKLPLLRVVIQIILEPFKTL